jgi:transcription factor MBP1
MRKSRADTENTKVRLRLRLGRNDSDISKAHGFLSNKARLWLNATTYMRNSVRFSSSLPEISALHLLRSTPLLSRRFLRSLPFQSGQTVSFQRIRTWEDSANRTEPVAAPSRGMDDDYDNISAQLNDDESLADDITVASASFMAEDDRYDMSQQGTGHRKRKRDDALQTAQNAHDQAHMLYADDLLDYFMLTHDSDTVTKPEPPLNFQPDWIIDTDGHTALHWGASMGDMSVVKELVKHGANLSVQNVRGETPLMRSVMFTNCQDKQSMPSVVKELISTIEMTDFCQATALHHAAAITISRQKHHSSRYYLDVILNKMQEVMEPDQVQRILDARDIEGNTAVHIAAKNGARKCVRALIGRGASTDILNNDKLTAEDWIRELHSRHERNQAGSSSPYAPDYALTMPEDTRRTTTHLSEAAMSIESKIMPLMHEKFQDLAASFDEEFTEKEVSEKAAKRILRTTLEELHTINNNILDIQFEEDQEVEEHKKAHVAHLEQEVTSLIEQQQKLQLLSRTQHETSKSNGHMIAEDDVAERAMLAKVLVDQQDRRLKLVEQYREALSLAGAGEKGEIYRKLISKCIGSEVDMMDEEILNSLLEQLKDDEHGREGETVHPDDL